MVEHGPNTGSPQQEGPLREGAQPELNLGLPRPEEVAQRERRELVSKANKALLLFAEKAIPPLYDKVRRGEGKQVLSSTEEGRPGEELIDIDQTGENILKAAIREAQLPAILISENTPEPTEFGNGASEKFYVYQDPFDNTSQYKRGLDTPPYTVVSIWDKEGRPIGAVVGDIKDRKAYITIDGATFMWDLEKKSLEKQAFTERENKLLSDHVKLLEKKISLFSGPLEQIQQLTEIEKQIIEVKDRIQKNQEALNESQRKEPERKKITKSERTTLKDRNSTLATFVGEKEYSSEFFKYFSGLVNDMHPKGLLYTGGGAYIYGLLASGAVDAYVMFNEPVSEIIPGLPLALAAGCKAWNVKPDGTYEEYKFNPNDIRANHKLYSEGAVQLLVVSANTQIRDEVISYYLGAQREIVQIERWEGIRKEFTNLTTEELKAFLETKRQDSSNT